MTGLQMKGAFKVGQQWHFEQDDQSQWHWKHLEEEAESEKSFPSAAECMLDAVRHAVNQRRGRVAVTKKKLLQ